MIEQLYAVQALPQLINEAKEEQKKLLDDVHHPRWEDEKDQLSETSSITIAESIAQPLELLSLDTDMTNDDKLLVARTQSPMLIEQLLSEWTNLDDAQPADREGKSEAKDAATPNAEDAERVARDGPRRARSEEENTEIEAPQGRDWEKARKEHLNFVEWAEQDDRRRARKKTKEARLEAEVEAENTEIVAPDDRRRARKTKEEAELEVRQEREKEQAYRMVADLEARQEREKQQAYKEQELKDQWLEERRIRRAQRDKRREEEDERAYAVQRRKEREAERAARESIATNERLLRSKNAQNPTTMDRLNVILVGDGKQEWTRSEDDPDKFERKASMREVFKMWREMSKGMRGSSNK